MSMMIDLLEAKNVMAIVMVLLRVRLIFSSALKSSKMSPERITGEF
jgi:hypothetical protein